MLIKELAYDNNGIARSLIESDSGHEYLVSVDSELFRSWCSCPYYVYNGTSCKHIMFLMNNLDYNKMNKKENFDFISTDCNTLDTLLGGGVPISIITTIYGEPTSGKTMFSRQMGLASIAKTGKNTILIETEGLRDYDTKILLYKFMGRYGLDKETIDKKYITKGTLGDMKLQSVQKLFMMFGYLVTFEISKNGKYSAKFEKCVPSITEKEFESTGMIILDSLTKPIKDSVGAETQNLPTRAQLIERLFGLLYHYAQLYNIAIIVVHHATINPVTPFGRDLGKPYGGDSVLYNSKYALEFIDATSKIKNDTTWGEEARRVRLLRRPDEPYTGELLQIRLKKDWGFCDE